MIRARPFSQRELGGIGIVANPTKTVAAPPKRHVLMVEEMLPLACIDVRIAEEGEVPEIGVPIGTDTLVLKRAVG